MLKLLHIRCLTTDHSAAGCRRGLSLYAARRNNALERDGVSRLSAYHHYGMVSPFKVAREAALDKSGGWSLWHRRAWILAPCSAALPKEPHLFPSPRTPLTCPPVAHFVLPAGATKYLDEFLTWREVSYLYCLHHLPRLHSLDALPRWACAATAWHCKCVVEIFCKILSAELAGASWNSASVPLCEPPQVGTADTGTARC